MERYKKYKLLFLMVISAQSALLMSADAQHKWFANRPLRQTSSAPQQRLEMKPAPVAPRRLSAAQAAGMNEDEYKRFCETHPNDPLRCAVENQ